MTKRMAKLMLLISASLPFTAQAAVTVAPTRELFIKDLKVVNDPVRTAKCGAWTFCNLMTKMAGTQDPATFTLNWLNQWKVDRVINNDKVPKRPAIQDIIDGWPKLSGGRLDLSKAPFRLLAIVNRMDLRNAGQKNAGEGRLIFGLLAPDGSPLSMTVIFEYKLWTSIQSQEAWAKQWHALGDTKLKMGSSYNAALQKVTDKFTAAALTGRPNGSAIGQVRTNEIALAFPWELREFILNAKGQLVQTTVKMTPGQDFNGSAKLAQYINANESAILKESHVIRSPLQLGGAAPVSFAWDAPGIRNPEARHKFGLNTCSGCHQSETSTPFLHVSNRLRNQESTLSDFFANTTVFDAQGTPRIFNELNRRRLNFAALITLITSDDALSVMPETGLSAEQQLQSTDTPSGVVH